MTRTIIIPIINILNMESLLFFILHNFVIDENNRNKKDERRVLHGAEKTYYISIANGQISQVKTADTYNFEISANDEEITELREYFDQAYVEDLGSFVRSTFHLLSIIMIQIMTDMMNNYKKHIK